MSGCKGLHYNDFNVARDSVAAATESRATLKNQNFSARPLLLDVALAGLFLKEFVVFFLGFCLVGKGLGLGLAGGADLAPACGYVLSIHPDLPELTRTIFGAFEVSLLGCSHLLSSGWNRVW